MHEETQAVAPTLDIKPIVQVPGGVQDLTLSEAGVTLQQLQYIQKAIGENQQAVKILQGTGDGQELKILRTGDLKDVSGHELKIIPAQIGEPVVGLSTNEGTQVSEVTYVDSGSVQGCEATIQEVRYIQQDDGGTQAVVDVPEDGEANEVQTIMVEVPYGQELDANSIMTLLQQHQQ